MTQYMFSPKLCYDLTKCCKHIQRVHDSTKWGHIRFLELKNPTDPACLAQLQQAGQTPGVTLITRDKAKGLYILHCPHPPCSKGIDVDPALLSDSSAPGIDAFLNTLLNLGLDS